MKKFLLITMVGLVGCTITTTVQYPTKVVIHDKVLNDTTDDTLPPPIVDHSFSTPSSITPSSKQDTCPPFQLPALGTIPELPIAELAKIDPKDNVAVDKIVQKHIKEVRLDDLRIRDKILRAYRDYQKQCKAYQRNQK